MGSLGRHCLRASLWACGFVALAALAAGAVRLLPWLVAPDVPLGVSIPFAQALGAVAVETALLLGVPTGFALGAARFVDRGEARALGALGASPLRLVLGAAPHAAGVAAFALLTLIVCDVDAQAPGRVAARLVEQAKSSCTEARAPRSAWVPIVGVTWLCFPGRPARVVGTLPRLGTRAWFTATDLRPSPDLQQLSLDELRLVARSDGSRPALQVAVRHAAVSGLAPWGRVAKLPGRARAALVAVVAALLSLLVAWVVVAANRGSQILAGAIGAASALTALQVLHAVDRSACGTLAYLWVPAAAATAGVAIGLGLRRISWRGGGAGRLVP